MAATAKCPHCGLDMDVPADLAGGEVECPGCTRPFSPEIADLAAKVLEEGAVRCPRCDLEMDVPPDLRGGDVECPRCDKVFPVGGEWADEFDDEDFDRPRRRPRDPYDDLDYDYERRSPERRRAMALARLKPAAIALMICAILRLLVAGSFAVFGGVDLLKGGGNPGTLMIAVVCSILFIKESVTVYGAWLMMNGRSYAWGLIAGILMLIPTCDYCLWLFYMGFGIWAIVAVNDTDVRWLFRRQQRIEREMEGQHD